MLAGGAVACTWGVFTGEGTSRGGEARQWIAATEEAVLEKARHPTAIAHMTHGCAADKQGRGVRAAMRWHAARWHDKNGRIVVAAYSSTRNTHQNAVLPPRAARMQADSCRASPRRPNGTQKRTLV